VGSSANTMLFTKVFKMNNVVRFTKSILCAPILFVHCCQIIPDKPFRTAEIRRFLDVGTHGGGRPSPEPWAT